MQRGTTTYPETGTERFSGFDSLCGRVRVPDGRRIWKSLAWAFSAYWLLFVASGLASRSDLNSVGAVFILLTMAWAILGRLWVKLDGVALAALAAAFIPLLNMAVFGRSGTTDAIIKHESLCAVIVMSRALRLPALSQLKLRWVFAFQILMVLLLSVTVHRGTSWEGGTRHSGLFINPNNLALIPFLLLLLIDGLRDSPLMRLGAHAIVTAVLIFAGTSGAIIAYLIGLTVHLIAKLSHSSRLIVSASVLALGLATFGLVAMDGSKFLPDTRLTRQLSVMHSQLGTVLEGGYVSYYQQERTLGPGSTSAMWRLAHWRDTIVTYLDGSPSQKILGFGLGSSPVFLGLLPHNEYLRALFEQGIAGLALFLFIWTRIILSAPASIRYVGLIIAIYSFSENNLDNFPFMSLFILCLSALELPDIFSRPSTRLKARPQETVSREWQVVSHGKRALSVVD